MYEFSFGAFFAGLIILAIGALGVVYYQKIADNLGSGVSSYEKFRLWALIVCGVGLAVMLSLHSILLNLLIDTVFRR